MAGLQDSTIRVVLLGKTGAGKSSLGNTLLGRDEIEVMPRGLSSGNGRCQLANVETEGVLLQVIDTPGLCDTDLSDQVIMKEISKCVAVGSPGPHVILLVLRCYRRFSGEEKYAYCELKKLFGEDIKQFMIIVFVGIDEFNGTPEENEIQLKRAVEQVPGDLQDVLRDSRGRYIGVNNRASRHDRNRQAKKILAAMQDLVASNGGQYFSNAMCEEVGLVVAQNIENRMRASNTTHREAERETKRAIADETMGLDWNKILSIIEKAFTLFIKLVDMVSDDASKSGSKGKAGAEGGGTSGEADLSMRGCSLM